MKAYATASGGVIFVEDEIARKEVSAAPASYFDMVVSEDGCVGDSPLMAPDYSMAGDMAKTA